MEVSHERMGKGKSHKRMGIMEHYDWSLGLLRESHICGTFNLKINRSVKTQ